ncbi:hypothetical protein ABPG72_017658 [Tetrahymena utriculariae]
MQREQRNNLIPCQNKTKYYVENPLQENIFGFFVIIGINIQQKLCIRGCKELKDFKYSFIIKIIQQRSLQDFFSLEEIEKIQNSYQLQFLKQKMKIIISMIQ